MHVLPRDTGFDDARCRTWRVRALGLYRYSPTRACGNHDDEKLLGGGFEASASILRWALRIHLTMAVIITVDVVTISQGLSVFEGVTRNVINLSIK